MPTILVVDDHLDFTFFVSEILEDEGYAVLQAHDGETAMDLLVRQAPDLLVADLNMPGMGGGELLRRAKQIYPGVPVVMVSGLDCTSTAVACMKYGASDYLLKPCDAKRLLEVVRECLRISVEEESAVGPAPPDASRLSKYKLVQKLGMGTFGTVYLAETLQDGRPTQVALKILHSGLGGADGVSQEVSRRFQREAEVTAAIRHPHIVRILDFNVEEGNSVPYLAMEYLDGRPLARIPYHEQDWRRICHIIRQVASALQALHEAQVVHRDVKPGNIMVGRDGHATLMDFGVIGLSNSELTNTDMTVGTPLYMAPETFVTSHVTAAADLFSLGTVAYEYIMHAHPFDVGKLPDITDAIRFRPLPELTPEQAQALPPDLLRILKRMLAKRPGQRYADAAELVADLDALLARHPSTP